MGWLQTLAAELPITLADGSVWLSIGEGLLIGAICLLFGVWVARFVGLLGADAPAGETLGVGLASGLLVLTSWWAAFASGGRSSFTPVAVGFAIAIGLAAVRRRRPAALAEQATKPLSLPVRIRQPLLALAGGALFVVAVALVYGSTMAPSPRDRVQPVEFSDEAYYSVLAEDLAATGTESLYAPSGFEIGPQPQTWYHWGEIWLASALIRILAADPIQARHMSVLPVLLLALAALTGTLVRRMTRTLSGGAFMFGLFACLFLAPIPYGPGPFFASWATGMIFGVTLYGFASVAVLLALYSVSVLDEQSPAWPLAIFVGITAAFIVPAHLAVGLLAAVGIASVLAIRVVGPIVTSQHPPGIPTVWRRTYITAGIAVTATVIWGLATEHGLGTNWPSPTVSPFDTSWRDSVLIIFACSGAFMAIAIAWYAARHEASIETSLYLGTSALIVVGAIVWGVRLGDQNMGHLFFGGIAVFATPVAAIAVWSIWLRLRSTNHVRLGIAMFVFCIAQLEVGLGSGIVRLVTYGPGSYPPVALETFAAIRKLPPDAKLAYACSPFEEVAFWAPQLLSLDAHTGRRVVPMCFEAESYPFLFGKQLSADVPSPLFELAPQRRIYPDSVARPSPAMVAAFLKENGIDYIYADARHPNSLVPDAISLASNGDVQILAVP